MERYFKVKNGIVSFSIPGMKTWFTLGLVARLNLEKLRYYFSFVSLFYTYIQAFYNSLSLGNLPYSRLRTSWSHRGSCFTHTGVNLSADKSGFSGLVMVGFFYSVRGSLIQILNLNILLW
jgi:hypothetical protein